ncbi:hypothetical protein BPA01_11630 [Brevibacillus parabrevis]|jgi:hypothetical protein|uniref:DUF3887 domain-containing protein n=1 Tax=Brevibacillus parabrevis TaxID=54914 RepID=A0A4Y3PDD7_BREPA|nr:hypothetical protein BPA01_11630 [Brevibacillus parabrevis]
MFVTRRFLPFLGVLLSFVLISWPVHAEEQGGWEKAFQAQIQTWMKELASRDPQFKEWQKADTEVQTLGPNQHQWLVSIKKADKQVGYLVVGETVESNVPEKFVLLEYGVGEYILFDDAFAPREIAAEPVYDGFASHWLIARQSSAQMVNAKTGEAYPASFAANEPTVLQNLVQTGQKLTQTRTLQSAQTDPFDQIGWFNQMQRGSAVTWSELWQQQNNASVTLTVSLYHAQVLAPYAVGSLHLWNDQSAYVGVWDEGLRFVPYVYADKIGKFYVSSPQVRPPQS